MYNGKELQEELGLNWLSFGFREYDPAIGRFPSVDPIADQFAWASPFNYAENEPVGHVDLWGLQKREFMGIHDPNGIMVSYKSGGRAQMRKDVDAFYEGFDRGVAYSMAAGGIMFLAIEAGAAGTVSFIGNEVKDEALSYATNGWSDIFDITKRVKQGYGMLKNPKNASKYEDITKSSRGKESTPNKQTDVTKSGFEGNLEKSGFEKTTSADGNASTFTKDGTSYTTRTSKDGTPTADFRKDASSKTTDTKIRLEKENL